MRNLIVIMTVLLFTVVAQAQTVEVSKNNKIMVDGKEIATIEKQGCGALNPDCTFYIRNSEGKTLITIVAMNFKDPSEKTNANPDGLVRYLRFSFADGKGVAEVRNPAMLNTKPKDVAQIVVKSQLLKDNGLDENEVQNFIQTYGTLYSDRQKQLNNPVIIIR